jgi:hypothetical protein
MPLWGWHLANRMLSPKVKQPFLGVEKNIKHYYKTKLISNKQIVVFLFHVMLVTSLQPKVYQLSYISFGFIMMTFCVMWEGQLINIR